MTDDEIRIRLTSIDASLLAIVDILERLTVDFNPYVDADDDRLIIRVVTTKPKID